MNITKLDVSINGVPNRLYSNGASPYHLYEESYRCLAGTNRLDTTETNIVNADNGFQPATINNWFLGTQQYLAIDFRSTSDQHLHGSGLALGYNGDGILLTLTRTAGTGSVDMCVFLVMDAIAKFDDGRFVGIIY